MRIFNVRVTRPRVIRVLADAIFVQIALILAYAVRLLIVSQKSTTADMSTLSVKFVDAYFKSSWLVAVICLVCFAAAGFYNNGRTYRSHRVLLISVVVAGAYAMFGGVAFLNNNWFHTPRGIVPLGWVLTTFLVAGSRVASSTWANVLKAEGRLLGRRKLEDIEVQTVLVIGGGGYIGSALLPRLLGQGYNVRLFDLLLWGTEPIKKSIGHPKLEIFRGDFRQIDRVVEAMRGVDAVVHLGGIVGDPACALDESLTIDVNLAATRLIAEVARGEGVQRLLFASTCSVYGAGDDLLDEHSTTRPLSLYARTKLASERVLLEMAGDDFAPVIFRFGTIFGLSGRTRFDLVVNLLTAKAVTEGKITVFGGAQWRPFVHVDDAARAVFTMLEAPLDRVRNEIFNVGSEAGNLTIMDVAELIHAAIPDSEIINVGGDSDKRNYRGDFSKLRDMMEFEPSWSVEAGIRQVEEAIRSGEVQDYMDPKYSNVKFLTESDGQPIAKPNLDWSMTILKEQDAALAAGGPANTDDEPPFPPETTSMPGPTRH